MHDAGDAQDRASHVSASSGRERKRFVLHDEQRSREISGISDASSTPALRLWGKS